MDISPTRHFTDRTFLRHEHFTDMTFHRQEILPTGHFSDMDISLTGHFSHMDISQTGHFTDRTFLRHGQFTDRTFHRQDISPTGHFTDKTANNQPRPSREIYRRYSGLVALLPPRKPKPGRGLETHRYLLTDFLRIHTILTFRRSDAL